MGCKWDNGTQWMDLDPFPGVLLGPKACSVSG